MLSIRDMFVQTAKKCPFGIEDYQVNKKYFDNKNGDTSKVKKRILKRGSYLDDYQRTYGSVPGPGVYDCAKNLWPENHKIPRNKPADKRTFIDDIMRQCKKEKKPAPGQYQVEKSLKQIDQENKELARKKTHQSDRITYLDGVQYEAAQTPGVGKYNTRPRPHSSYNSKKDKPEDWRKKHQTIQKKKLIKTPDMGSYNPREVKSYEKKVTKEGEWGREERFSRDRSGSGIGPGKYIVMDDWTHKNEVFCGRVRPKSAYYH